MWRFCEEELVEDGSLGRELLSKLEGEKERERKKM